MGDGKILSLGTSTYTAERGAEVERLVLAGRPMREIATILGVAYATLMKWRRDNPGFAQRLKVARDRAIIAGQRTSKGPGLGMPRTKRAEDAILEHIRRGLSRVRAAALAGIPSTSFERWLEDEDFGLRVAQAEALWEREMLVELSTAGPQWTRIMTHLERRLPDTYARRFEMPWKERQQMAAKMGGALAEAVAQGLSEAGLTADQQEAVRRKLVRAIEVSA